MYISLGREREKMEGGKASSSFLKGKELLISTFKFGTHRVDHDLENIQQALEYYSRKSVNVKNTRIIIALEYSLIIATTPTHNT